MDDRTYSFAAVVLSLVAMMIAVTAATEQTDPATISVSGHAEVTSPPEVVDAVLAVETESTDVQDAQAQNRNRSAAVMDALRAAGIPEDRIETTDYRVQTITERDRDGVAQPTRYRVTNQVTVEIEDIQTAGSILDTAVEAGANRIDSVTFDVTDETRQQLQDEAMQEAAGVAEQKAGSLADRLGVSVGTPVRVSESNYDIYRFESAYRGGAGDAAQAPSTQINPGDVTVSAQVAVEYMVR